MHGDAAVVSEIPAERRRRAEMEMRGQPAVPDGGTLLQPQSQCQLPWVRLAGSGGIASGLPQDIQAALQERGPAQFTDFACAGYFQRAGRRLHAMLCDQRGFELL